VTAEFETGQRFGAYTLGKLLGRGGMGVVYQAQHVHLGRTVALKLLAPELSKNEDFRARFLRESRLAAALDHPGIVTVYDAGDVNGVLFIAMRYVRGTDLAALIAQRAPLPVDETLAILDQVATALDAAHAAGLVHRDVKPANVMIEGQRCYLADFGLTKRATGNSVQLTAAGTFLGTVDYVAPEQIEGREVDGRADVYALTCVLFECLTGSRPYPRDSQVAVLYAQLREPPPRPCELRPDLPAAIDVVVGRGMAKLPEGRYSSCGELVAAARAALTARATTAPPQPAPAPPPQPAPAPPRPPAPAQPAPAPPPQPAPTAPREIPRATAPLPPPSLPTAPLPAASLPTAPLPPTGPVAAAPAGRRSLVLPLVAVAVLVAAGIAAAIALSGGGSSQKPVATSPAVAAAPPPAPPAPNGPHVVGSPIQLGGKPLGVVFRGGEVWVADSGDSSVVRVGAADGKQTRIAVGDGPFDVAGNSTSIWTANSRSDTVSRVDVRTGKASAQFPVGSKPMFLTAEESRVFVANSGDGTVSVLDAHTGAPLSNPIRVGSEPTGMTTGAGSAWVANRGSNTVSQIKNGQVLNTIPVGSQPVGVIFGQGSLWVTNETSGTVSRIQMPPGSSPVTATKVGSNPYGIAFGEGFVWVTNRADGTVMRIDPSTGRRVGAAIPVPGEPVSLATLGGFVWVTSYSAGTLTRIQP
jgi:YVTN family beta-propeller protein